MSVPVVNIVSVSVEVCGCVGPPCRVVWISIAADPNCRLHWFILEKREREAFVRVLSYFCEETICPPGDTKNDVFLFFWVNETLVPSWLP